MLELMARNWWVVALRGSFAVIFGALALIWPGPSLLVLVILFGAFALVDGISSLISIFTGPRSRSPTWVLVLHGVVGVLAGLIAIVWPGITALALLYVIAFWAIMVGILEIATAVRLRDVMQYEWVLGITGVVSVLFGIALVIVPDIGLLTLVLLVGIYALFSGLLLIAAGFQLRRLRRQLR